jgi:hypothetical protein
MVFPIVAPPDPHGPWFEQTWIYIISESFHVNMSSSGSVVLGKIFKWPNPFLWLFPLWRGPGPLFVQVWIPFIQGWLVQILSKIGLLVLEKIFFFNINTCKYLSLLWPSKLPGTMVWINLNLKKQTNLISLHQGEFVPSMIELGSGEENFFKNF